MISSPLPPLSPPPHSFGDPPISFPADFPDTAAGRRHWDDIGRESMSAWARTRPKHRGFKAKHRVPVQKAAQESDVASSRLGLCRFRPDFCSLAMGLSSYVTPNAQVEVEVEVSGADDVAVKGISSVGEGTGASAEISTGTADGIPNEGGDEEVVHKDGKESDGPPAVTVVSSVDGGQRDFFAVARGFSYVQAFLPGDGIRDDADDEQMLPRKGLLPPLQLAFPTMLEVLVSPLDSSIPLVFSRVRYINPGGEMTKELVVPHRFHFPNRIS